jgi:hypothetical protein
MNVESEILSILAEAACLKELRAQRVECRRAVVDQLLADAERGDLNFARWRPAYAKADRGIAVCDLRLARQKKRLVALIKQELTP